MNYFLVGLHVSVWVASVTWWCVSHRVTAQLPAQNYCKARHPRMLDGAVFQAFARLARVQCLFWGNPITRCALMLAFGCPPVFRQIALLNGSCCRRHSSDSTSLPIVTAIVTFKWNRNNGLLPHGPGDGEHAGGRQTYGVTANLRHDTHMHRRMRLLSLVQPSLATKCVSLALSTSFASVSSGGCSISL